MKEKQARHGTVGVALVVVLMTMGFAPQAQAIEGSEEETDVDHRLSEQARFVTESCGQFGEALPVFSIEGNGGSWLKIYQSVRPIIVYDDYWVPEEINWEGKFYASWSLMTNNIANGADAWNMGLEIFQDPNDVPETKINFDGGGLSPAETSISRTFYQNDQSGTCAPLGWIDQGESPGWAIYYEGGADGWMTASECTTETNWEVGVGLSTTVTDPIGAEVTVKYGGSYACSDGGTWDSESLLLGTGYVQGYPNVDLSDANEAIPGCIKERWRDVVEGEFSPYVGSNDGDSDGDHQEDDEGGHEDFISLPFVKIEGVDTLWLDLEAAVSGRAVFNTCNALTAVR